ncbi:hypothetical protein H310_09122 [Aphanomyces invadans]|uniref:Cytidyltransferase-like domain-containing protein n=1 Tax=Aphanomyces invadans TaxID=157072 RepID=A0A024TUB6_9STRA|nr:hypothetical protein H310_09122 [Aphanomyces invadans]ETV97765.1 hypothetical protein H310_09122 [Aphanomyces invadans]|eukprot:XP_008873326.1 hypothetical protein H310_09122 [Aphanomyces invadans]
MKRALQQHQDESTYERRPHLVISLESQQVEFTPRTTAKHRDELVALRQRVHALETLLAQQPDHDPVLKPPHATKLLPPLAAADLTMTLSASASLTQLPPPSQTQPAFTLPRQATAPGLLLQPLGPTSNGPTKAMAESTHCDPRMSTKFIADQDGSLVVAVSKRSRLYEIIQRVSNRVRINDEQILRLKKIVDAEFGDVIAVLEGVDVEPDASVVTEKLHHLIQTGSPSKHFAQGSPPKFHAPDVPYPLIKIAHALSMLTANQEVVVLVSSGAYNPVHMLHIRAFYVARQHIESNYSFPVVGGIISPCHDTYVRTKNRRKPREMIPKAHRLAMLEAATASSTWIEVDKWEITRRRVLDYLSTLTHVREICEHQFPHFKFRVLYVCGVNTIVKLSHTALKEEGFGVMAICRPNQTDMLHKHLGAKWSKTAIVVEDTGVLACELERATSFRVRQALIQGNVDVAPMVGKNVDEYMHRHRIGDKVAGREPWTSGDRLWRAQDLPHVEYIESELIQCRHNDAASYADD